MPGFIDILDGMSEKPPRSLVRTNVVIPEWQIGAIYKSGAFVFLLKEMDTEGMTLEIVDTPIDELKASELLSAGKLEKNSDLMRSQLNKSRPIDPQSIMPRVS